jgi:hypothetical protein
MAPDSKPQSFSFEQVSRDLLSLFEQQPDIGTFSILSDWILERPNVFDPGSRSRPKPELLIVLIYLLLAAAGFALFNLR